MLHCDAFWTVNEISMHRATGERREWALAPPPPPKAVKLPTIVQRPLSEIPDPFLANDPPTTDRVIAFFAWHHAVTPADIRGRSRARDTVKARYEAAVAIVRHCRRDGERLTVSDVARAINKDRSVTARMLGAAGVLHMTSGFGKRGARIIVQDAPPVTSDDAPFPRAEYR